MGIHLDSIPMKRIHCVEGKIVQQRVQRHLFFPTPLPQNGLIWGHVQEPWVEQCGIAGPSKFREVRRDLLQRNHEIASVVEEVNVVVIVVGFQRLGQGV